LKASKLRLSQLIYQIINAEGKERRAESKGHGARSKEHRSHQKNLSFFLLKCQFEVRAFVAIVLLSSFSPNNIPTIKL